MTKQINNHACVLACLESFLSDCGRPITQQEVIKKFPALCHKGEEIEGALAVSQESLGIIGKELRLLAEFTHKYRVPDHHEAYFIITTAGDKHCVRVESHLGNGRFQVMDPNKNRDSEREEFSEFDFPSKAIQEPVFIRIKMVE